MKKELFLNIIMRIFATFAASGLGVIGAGTIAGVPVWKSIFMAGIAGVATVVEGLSRAFLDDGKLTTKEINAVFSRFDKKGSAVTEEEIENHEQNVVKKRTAIKDTSASL
jgi:hypothetical protein